MSIIHADLSPQPLASRLDQDILSGQTSRRRLEKGSRALDSLTYERDVRDSDPEQSGHRRARFIEGWRKAVEGRTFAPETLRELTWENLGYRLGKLLGPTDDQAVAELYEWCVRQQAARPDA
jgi:hypothetical protein